MARQEKPEAAWSRLITEATAGNLQAQLLVGYAYSQGETIASQPDEAIRWYRAAAAQGSAEAEFSLGMLYCFRSLPEVPDAIYRLNLPLAQSGDPRAQYRVGVALIESKGLKAIEAGKEGVGWLEKAANKNQPDAQYQLAVLHSSFNLFTGTQRPDLAVKWLQLAAPHRAEAKYLLAEAMLRGEGTTKSEATALNLMREAAESGHRQAAWQYGEMLINGFGGVAVDRAKGREWIDRAGQEQVAPAKRRTIDEFFTAFEGPPHEAIKAHAWFNRASSKGYRWNGYEMSAQDAMYVVERFMSVEDKLQAEKLASSPDFN